MHYNTGKNPERLIFLLLMISVSLNPATAGEYKFINGLVAESDVRYGIIMSHTESIRYAINSNIAGLELSLSTKTYGRNGWDKLYRYPGLGIGYVFTTLGNKDIFGNGHAIFPFVNFPFIAKEKKLHTGYRISLGLGYVSKQFHVHENPLNMAISSGLNMYVSLRFYTNYQFNSNNEFTASVEFSHFSNGKIGSPNMGLNTGVINLGYRYKITNSRYNILHHQYPVLSKRHQAEVFLSGGTKTDDQLSNKYYPIASVTCGYKYILNDKYAAGTGIDFFYDPSLGPNKVAVSRGMETYDSEDLFQAGIHAAIHARYARITAFGNIGTYIYASYVKYTRIYTRIGLRYDITKNLIFNLSVKAHYANADFIEWGVGYRLF